jgi:gamma-glutamyltranspeptidase / glutathione hydrolase
MNRFSPRPPGLVYLNFGLFVAATLCSSTVMGASHGQPSLSAGAIATSDVYGARAAQEIMNEGGNVADAAVAVAFVEAVTYPEAGNIGGGGFLTLWFEGHPYFLDYRETAPAAASRNMYLDPQGEVIENLSLVGNLSVGVP